VTQVPAFVSTTHCSRLRRKPSNGTSKAPAPQAPQLLVRAPMASLFCSLLRGQRRMRRSAKALLGQHRVPHRCKHRAAQSGPKAMAARSTCPHNASCQERLRECLEQRRALEGQQPRVRQSKVAAALTWLHNACCQGRLREHLECHRALEGLQVLVRQSKSQAAQNGCNAAEARLALMQQLNAWCREHPPAGEQHTPRRTAIASDPWRRLRGLQQTVPVQLHLHLFMPLLLQMQPPRHVVQLGGSR